ncbi:MAG: Zn-dependent protease with chaperone function, partial [Rhodothermales bacterium]
MDRETYVALIRRFEKDASANPVRFSARVRRWTFIACIIAYGLPLTCLAIGVALTVVGIAMADLRVISLIAALVVSSFGAETFRRRWGRLRTRSPECQLLREQAPQFFSLLDRISAASGASIDRVMVDDLFSASARCEGKLWRRDHNVLVINPQMMAALTVDQFHSVVAHECNHFSRQDGRRGMQIYRARHAIAVLTQGRNLGAWRAKIVSRFNAYTLVECRLIEFMADQASVRATSPAISASALLCAGAISAQLDEFWVQLWRNADLVEMPQDPFRELTLAIANAEVDSFARSGLQKALHEETDYLDTHPSFRDRVTAMGAAELAEEAQALACIEAHAGTSIRAISLLPTATLDLLCQQQSQRWRLLSKENWLAQREEQKKAQTCLAEKADDNSPRGLMDRAYATATLEGASASIPLLHAVLASKPEDCEALWMLGEALASEQDAEAISHYEAVMELSPHYSLPGCDALYRLLRSLGRLEEADTYRDRMVDYERKLNQTHIERRIVTPERLMDHKLASEDLNPIIESLRHVD